MDGSLVERYLECCGAERRLDGKTVRAYRCDLGQYLEWCGCEGGPATRESVRSYVAFLNGRYAASSVKRKVAALRAFMAWAAGEGEVEGDPFEGYRFRVREPERLPRTIPLADLDLLFTHLYGGGAGGSGFQLARDRAIVELLIATGVRVSELCALDLRSLDVGGRTARIAGKGDRERAVQLEDAHTLAALGDYLGAREAVAPAGEPALFLNRLGGRMSDRAVREMIDRRAREAGLSVHVTPHMFRHTFATLLLEGDVDIRYIQKLLGHSSLRTTEIYAHVASAKLREIMRESNPRRMIRV